jgi:hypothetical protein
MTFITAFSAPSNAPAVTSGSFPRESADEYGDDEHEKPDDIQHAAEHARVHGHCANPNGHARRRIVGT